MFSYALKSLRANITRLVATALAVILGIGFLASGLMLTDAMRAGLTGDVEEQYQNVDFAIIATASSEQSSGMDFQLTVPESVLATARDTPGVEAAAGEIQADARVLRPDGTTANLRSQGRSWIADSELNPLSLDEGSAPKGSAQVVLDRKLASEAGASVGDTVSVQTPAGTKQFKVSGISSFGRQDALDDGGTISFSEETAVQVLNAGTPGFSDVLLRTSGDPATVQAALEEALPTSVAIQTGEQFVSDAAESASAFISLLRPVLQGFAYLSMFVAAFVIFNTFSVVVTQRFRELALIRAVGGTPAQVRRSLIFEGMAIGVVASALGIVVGAGLAIGLQALLRQFDLEIPGAGVKISTYTVVLCMLIGVVVTTLSVIVPAFRAGRTKPVEAMRSSAVDTSGSSAVRAVFGAIFLLGAIALLLANRFVGVQWFYLTFGALFLFIGLFIGGPLLARLFAILVRPIMALFGMTGRLAADNAVRNPKRTATTANALVIGLFLVTLVTVSGEAMKTSLVDQLSSASSPDFIVSSQGAIDPKLVSSIDKTPGVTNTAAIKSSVAVESTGQATFVSAASLDELTKSAGLKVTSGSSDAVASGAGIAVPDFSNFGGGALSSPGAIGAGLGDVVILRTLDGQELSLPIVAVYEGSLESFVGNIMNPETFKSVVGEKPVSQVFVRVEPGQADAVGQDLEKVLQGYTGVEVQPGNFIGQIVGTVFDFLIAAVNALLAMSVIVALVGIVNTMTLSIFERRRELGMVRALGMTRQQVGRMVRFEAVLIGLLGTLVGMGAGILLSWVVISSIADGAIDLSFNWARVGLIFLVGILVGVVAS
ncbi:MAG: FtsX-like permease family protein, partial [Actinobacteria bacterium]|nr:FtsX-like permease family protein [Actinomycetota bacterium]